MLRLFKNDSLISVALILVLGVLLRLGLWMGVAVPEVPEESGGILFELLFGWLDRSSMLSYGLAFLLVIVQAILINRLVIHYRFLRERSFLFALMYVVFASAIPDFWVLTPALVGTTFVCFALDSLYSLYRSKQIEANLFNSSFWIILGSFFYGPMVMVMFLVIIGLIFLNTINFKHLLIVFSGAFVLLFFHWSLSYLIEGYTHSFWLTMGSYKLYLPDFATAYSQSHWVSLIVVGTFFAWVLLSFVSYFSRKLIQVQRYLALLYWLLLFVTISFLFLDKGNLSHFILAAPAVGILLGHSANESKSLLGEFIFLLVVGLIVAMPYLFV